MIPQIIVEKSRMYKKLHKTETHSIGNPYGHKGSLFVCVPERDIMLTRDVYGIHLYFINKEI